MQGNNHQSINILVIGEQNAGKSTLCRRFAFGKLDDQTISTVGIDLMVKRVAVDKNLVTEFCKKYPSKVLDNKVPVKISINDTSGQERFVELAKNWVEKADAILICQDTQCRESQQRMQRWVNCIVEHKVTVPTAIVACKCDWLASTDDDTNQSMCTEEKDSVDNISPNVSNPTQKITDRNKDSLSVPLIERFGSNKTDSLRESDSVSDKKHIKFTEVKQFVAGHSTDFISHKFFPTSSQSNHGIKKVFQWIVENVLKNHELIENRKLGLADDVIDTNKGIHKLNKIRYVIFAYLVIHCLFIAVINAIQFIETVNKYEGKLDVEMILCQMYPIFNFVLIFGCGQWNYEGLFLNLTKQEQKVVCRNSIALAINIALILYSIIEFSYDNCTVPKIQEFFTFKTIVIIDLYSSLVLGILASLIIMRWKYTKFKSYVDINSNK